MGRDLAKATALSAEPAHCWPRPFTMTWAPTGQTAGRTLRAETTWPSRGQERRVQRWTEVWKALEPGKGAEQGGCRVRLPFSKTSL